MHAKEAEVEEFPSMKKAIIKLHYIYPQIGYIVISTRENINFVQKFGKYNVIL